MLKITKDDLTKKTDAQLSALFQEVSRHLPAKTSTLTSAESLLSMIRAELARRGPRP